MVRPSISRPPPAPPPTVGALAAAAACAGGAAAAARCAPAGATARGESAAQQSPGPMTSVNGRPASPDTYLMSEKFGGGGTSDPEVMPTLLALANAVCVSGS